MAKAKERHTLFTAVVGVVTLTEIPVAGARIEQRAKLGANEPETQKTKTGEDGRFALPRIDTPKGWSSLLPQQFAVGQEIIITANGNEFVGWVATKFEPDPGAETGSDPIRLVCELSADESGGENHVGICRVVKTAT